MGAEDLIIFAISIAVVVVLVLGIWINVHKGNGGDE